MSKQKEDRVYDTPQDSKHILVGSEGEVVESGIRYMSKADITDGFEFFLEMVDKKINTS